MPSAISDLASARLDQLLPLAIDRLRNATLDELLAILRASPSGALSEKELAKAVLALPGEGSKLAAERAVIVHAIEISNGNVSAAARLLGDDRKALERARRIKRGR